MSITITSRFIRSNYKHLDTGFIPEISIAKGIAILLAVVGHSLPDAVKSFWIVGKESFYYDLYIWIYTFHMATFFLCSGFLLFYKTSQASLRSQLRKRTKRLIVPYMFYSLTYLFLKSVLGNFADHPLQGGDFWRIFIGESPCYGIWFLWTLFVVSALLLTIRKFTQRWTFFFALSIVLYSFPFFFNMPRGFASVSTNFIWIVLGGYLATHYKWMVHLKMKQLLFALSWGILAIFIFVANLSLPFVSTLLGVLGLYLLAYCISNVWRRGMLYRVFDIMGIYCMDIYLFSMFILVPLRILYVNFNVMSVLPYPAYVVVAVIAGVVLPILISKYGVRRVKFLKRVLLGV